MTREAKKNSRKKDGISSPTNIIIKKTNLANCVLFMLTINSPLQHSVKYLIQFANNRTNTCIHVLERGESSLSAVTLRSPTIAT